jgi:hypothetical protein
VQRLDAHWLARLGPLSTPLDRDNDAPPPAVLLATATRRARSPCPPATRRDALHRAAISALEGPALIMTSHMRSPAIDRTNHSNAWTA